MGGFKEFWRHIDNDGVYAIESTGFGEVLGAAGPLDPKNLHNLNDYEYTPKINLWIKKAIAENKLRRFNP